MAHRKVRCEFPGCDSLIDRRGMNGHMKTHERHEAVNGNVKKPVQYVTDVEVTSWKSGYREGFQDAKRVA